MAKSKIPRHIDPGKQINAMKALFPKFSAKVQGHKVVFKGKLRVKPEFQEYSLEIIYDGDKKPKVYVRHPELAPNAPHIYPQGRYLCLYHPSNFTWTAEKLVAKEIMQWTIAWLYFYECWLDTGVWYGPEVAHGELKG